MDSDICYLWLFGDAKTADILYDAFTPMSHLCCCTMLRYISSTKLVKQLLKAGTPHR